MSVEQPLDPETVEATRAQIRGTIAQVAELARSEAEPIAFFDQFLNSVIAALAAAGGAVWKLADNGKTFEIVSPKYLPAGLPTDDESQRTHAQLLGGVLNTEEPSLVRPGPWTGDESEIGNPTSYLLLLAPLKTPRATFGVVELFQRSGVPSQAQRGYLKFLTQMLELAAEYLRTREVLQLSQREAMWDRLDRFGEAVHGSLDLTQTAYTLANEALSLIECDRVSVAVCRHRRDEILAVSGQDTVEKRSNAVSLLRALTERVIASRQPLWYAGDTTELPPQIEDVLHAYIDETHTRTLGIVPLFRPQPVEQEDDNTKHAEILGALVVEQIDQEGLSEQLRNRTDLVVRKATPALANALDHDRVFLMPLWRALGKTRWFIEARRLPWTVTIGAAVLVVLLGLCILPADFRITAQGTLQPFERQDVFVQEAGVVSEVLVEHGDQVQEGQELVRLRSRDLEVAITELRGRRASTLEQLAAARRAAGEPRLSFDERNRLSGQQAQLQETYDSLSDQLQMLLAKQELLTIRSPIVGQVVTWDVRKRLAGRPVEKGQVLMAIADPQRKWELELLVPEAHAGFVAAAWESAHALKQQPEAEIINPPVNYIVATNPARSHQGEVIEIQQSAEVRGDDGNTVLVRVKIASDELDSANLRPGAAVTGRIYCGRRAIGYVWFHDVLAFIRAKILFRI